MQLNRLSSRSHPPQLGQLNASQHEHCATLAKPAQSDHHAAHDGGAAANT